MTDIDSGLNTDALVLGTARGPGIWIAAADTEGPATAADDWPAGWTSLGYATEEGVTLAASTDTTEIMSWQSLGRLRVAITGRNVTIHTQLLEYTMQNIALYWDIDVPTVAADGSFSFDVRSDEGGKRHAIGVDIKDGENRLGFVFPRCTLQSAADMQFQKSALGHLDVTFSILEDNNVLFHHFGQIAGLATTLAAPLAASSRTVDAGD